MRPGKYKAVLLPCMVLTFALCVLLFARGTKLQGQGLPPFPILYGGQALVNGEPVPEGTDLAARVGDYETWTTVEKDGIYRNLLVAPPSPEYYQVSVTFHALGLAAQEQDVFLQTGGPTFKTLGFDLHFSRLTSGVSPQPTGSPIHETQSAQVRDDGEGAFSWALMAIGTGATLVLLLAWFRVRKV